MRCLKCGRQTEDEQVFCPQCLSQMEAYPVKQDIHIQLPNRPAESAPKKAGRKKAVLSPEEQLSLLKKRLRRLTAALVVLALLLCAALAGLIYDLSSTEDLDWGKNYTVELPFG